MASCSCRATEARLWWPRCAKARTGGVFCCADSTLGSTQGKDRGTRKLPAHGGKSVVGSAIGGRGKAKQPQKPVQAHGLGQSGYGDLAHRRPKTFTSCPT